MDRVIAVVYAHPYPHYSRACATLLEAIRDLPGLQLRSLYDRYPDFDIDVRGEQQALEEASLVVWLAPFYWYGAPSMLHLWFEKVLLHGWAFGTDWKLEGKDCLWVTTTGGTEEAFTPAGRHGQAFEAFVPALEQTARFCRMNWLEPFIVMGAHEVKETALREAGVKLRQRLEAWIGREDLGPGLRRGDDHA
jgi:glutathione-regulated potassium-efflux system ancillary protein KefF